MSQSKFVKFYFSDSPDLLYFKEIGNLSNPFDCLNILVQGYVRALNAMVDGFLKEDIQSTRLLRDFSLAIVNIFNRSIEKDGRSVVYNQPNLLNLIYNYERNLPEDERIVTTVLNTYKEVSGRDHFTKNISVKFELLYGDRGPAVFYDVTFHMNSFIQLHAYTLLFLHLIENFVVDYSELFIYYIAAINYLIDKQIESYSTPFGMPRLIKSATPMMIDVAKRFKNPYIGEYINYLPKW